VGGSFVEIFFGNCTALGIPCLAADMADVDWLQRCTSGSGPSRRGCPEGARRQLTTGTWSATSVRLEAGDQIEQVAARLPYIAGY
jgi:3-isopropylmalate/(R)-2-methylmalate dehydratase small subunit